MMSAARQSFIKWCATSLLLLACTNRPSPRQPDAIEAWLNCDECVGGERNSVKTLGVSAINQLKAALAGPSVEQQQTMRAKFEATWQPDTGQGLSQNAYVERLVSNYVASYQERAATALSDIGGSEARNALDAAIADSSARAYRSDVLETIKAARARAFADPFPGDVSPKMVAFGDTVTLIASPNELFNGDELVAIDDQLFPASEIFVNRTANQLKFLAVSGASGWHVATLSNAGTTNKDQAAVFTITSLLDANDRAMLSCGDLDCQIGAAPTVPTSPVTALPFTTFLSLWSIPPRLDTIDVFKVKPTTDLHVTARLDWGSGANLDLRWLDCVTKAPLASSGGATSGKPEISTLTILGGRCAALLVVMRPNSAARAFPRLRVTSP